MAPYSTGAFNPLPRVNTEEQVISWASIAHGFLSPCHETSTVDMCIISEAATKQDGDSLSFSIVWNKTWELGMGCRLWLIKATTEFDRSSSFLPFSFSLYRNFSMGGNGRWVLLVRVTTTTIRRCKHEVKRAPKQEALASGAGGPEFIYISSGWIFWPFWKVKRYFCGL